MIRTLALLVASNVTTALGQETPVPVPQPSAAGQAPAAERPRGGAAPSDDAYEYGSPPALPAGSTQEAMWPAATAEGWAKPCLIPWQRTFDDALKVAREAEAPILVCVNMDGEIASEHYAGVRYRDPATAELLEPYVCVIASTYRHAPRDFDEQGRRVECPRFGRVTCGEHIQNERDLYEKYFDGRRISPRHIMLDLEGRESYDVFHSWDTATVFNAFVKGVEGWPPRKPLLRDGLSLPERVESPDIGDRIAVERGYELGDHAERVAILRALHARRGASHDDVLRLAVFGLDLECARLARQVLVESESESSIDVIAEALKAPLGAEERTALVSAAQRLGEKYPRARMLATIHQGLAMSTGQPVLLDAAGASAAEYAAGVEERAASAERAPEDPAARLLLAEALLACANEGSRDARWRGVVLADARANAEAAARLGLSSWRLHATSAAILEQLGETERARGHALQAIEGGMREADPEEAGPPELVRVRVLALFAGARQRAIRKAYQDKAPWPPEWLADVNAAYAQLVAHERVEEEDLVSYHDFLDWLGVIRRAGTVLEEALARFPDSPVLHQRLRARVLWEKGPGALEEEYTRRLSAPTASGQLTWFAGYASLIAAEHFRRHNESEHALAAYDRGIAHYERNIAAAPEGRDLCDHYIALAHAGRARVLLELGDLEPATNALLAGFARRVTSTGTMDGLAITPGMTALMLKERLGEAREAELSSRLRTAMDAMDPALFAEPDFAREAPVGGRDREPRQRRED